MSAQGKAWKADEHGEHRRDHRTADERQPWRTVMDREQRRRFGPGRENAGHRRIRGDEPGPGQLVANGQPGIRRGMLARIERLRIADRVEQRRMEPRVADRRQETLDPRIARGGEVRHVGRRAENGMAFHAHGGVA